MSELAQEELSALAAIYCEPGACEVLAASGDAAALSAPARARPAGPREEALPGRSRRGSAPGQHGRSRSLLSLVACPCPAGCVCWRPRLGRGARRALLGYRQGPARCPEGQRWERAGCSLETHGISFRIQISVKEVLDTDVLLKLLFHLPVNYPSTVPDISVNSDQLTRAQCMDVREKLLEQAKKHLSEPMVHDLILWVQQHLKDVIKQSAAVGKEKTTLSKGTEDGIWMLLLHLDHMRAKAKYVKTVEKWASNLRLTGRLMFMGKIILILLQGDRSSIKEYLILQKSSKVDVDSSGKKCKEKMMRVLCETELQSQHKRFQMFEVKEYSAPEELQKEFETAGLAALFTEFIPPLFK